MLKLVSDSYDDVPDRHRLIKGRVELDLLLASWSDDGMSDTEASVVLVQALAARAHDERTERRALMLLAMAIRRALWEKPLALIFSRESVVGWEETEK